MRTETTVNNTYDFGVGRAERSVQEIGVQGAIILGIGARVRFLSRIFFRRAAREMPEHLQRGQLGEKAAKRHLRRCGLKFLTANFRSKRGEIDLVFRDRDCLVFVEVKTRSATSWTRPAAAVNARKKRRLSRAALDYLRLLRNPRVKVRFDIVEVVLEEGVVIDVRHLPNTFPMAAPYRHG